MCMVCVLLVLVLVLMVVSSRVCLVSGLVVGMGL